MNDTLSQKSDMTRMDAACGVAMVAREVCEDAEIITFSDRVIVCPPRRGFALRDVVKNSQVHSGTYLGAAVKCSEQRGYDRLIIITDEQSHDAVPNPKGIGYMINVASYKNGVGYGPWMHMDGFSEAVINYIYEYEKLHQEKLNA